MKLAHKWTNKEYWIEIWLLIVDLHKLYVVNLSVRLLNAVRILPTASNMYDIPVYERKHFMISVYEYALGDCSYLVHKHSLLLQHRDIQHYIIFPAAYTVDVSFKVFACLWY